MMNDRYDEMDDLNQELIPFSLQLKLVDCPYCGEQLDIEVDASAGTQEYIEDCQVCCRPISMSVTIDEEGYSSVSARHEND